MTRPPYLNHGREHKSGGSYPIPGLGLGGEFALADGGTYTVAASSNDYLAPWTLTDNTNSDVFSLATTTHTDDTIHVEGGGVLIATASALWSGVASRNSDFVIQSIEDTIRHTPIYPGGAFGPAPWAGYSTIVDQAFLFVNGSANVRLQIHNGAAFDDGPQFTKIALVFIRTS